MPAGRERRQPQPAAESREGRGAERQERKLGERQADRRRRRRDAARRGMGWRRRRRCHDEVRPPGVAVGESHLICARACRCRAPPGAKIRVIGNTWSYIWVSYYPRDLPTLTPSLTFLSLFTREQGWGSELAPASPSFSIVENED